MAKLSLALLALAAAAAGVVSAKPDRGLEDFPLGGDGSAVVAASLRQVDNTTWNAVYFAISDNSFPSLSVDTNTFSVTTVARNTTANPNPGNATQPTQSQPPNQGNGGPQGPPNGNGTGNGNSTRNFRRDGPKFGDIPKLDNGNVGDLISAAAAAAKAAGLNGKQILSQLNSTNIAWQVTLFSVVEYVSNTTATDANNVTTIVNTGFHPGTDINVQEIQLNKHSSGDAPFGFDPNGFQNFDNQGNQGGRRFARAKPNPVTVAYNPISTVTTLVNNANVTVYTIQGNFSTGGNIKVIARIGDNPFTVNGNTVAAGNIKFDIEIQNFPYKRNDSSLAVRMLIASATTDISIDRAQKTHSFNGTVTKGGFFGWNSTVAGDGAAIPVYITNASDWRPNAGKGLFYSFAGTNVASYVWDPEIATSATTSGNLAGNGGNQPSSASPTVVASSLLMMTAGTIVSLFL